MTTTREAFEAWAINYGYRMDLIKDTQVFDCDQTAAALNAWKAATKKATAAEREACAQVCRREAEIQKASAKFCGICNLDQGDFDICEAAIRQGGDA